jgi:hypothetical protein
MQQGCQYAKEVSHGEILAVSFRVTPKLVPVESKTSRKEEVAWEIDS